MLEMKVINPAETEWVVPFVFASKKDGSFRLCLDYGKLQALKKSDLYLIHGMDEYIDSIADALIFSILDDNGGY